jgi:hypothetical protein
LIGQEIKMSDKTQLISMLRNEFNRWEELLAGLSEAQIVARQLPANLSIKDVIAHLRAWQQRSIAQMEATRLDREPEYPEWSPGLDPESDEDLDRVNAWIHETYREQPWPSVYRDWREGFLRFLELGAAIPENDLFDAGRYAWLEDYPLYMVLQNSYEHHHGEHLEPLLDWLREHRDEKLAG